MREFLLYVHIVAAMAWVGGTILLHVFGLLNSRSDDPGDLVRFTRHIDFLGKFYFNIAGILVAVFGIWLVIDSPVYGFDDWWVSAGLAVVIVSAALGIAFYAPQARAALAIAEERGAADTGFVAIVRRIIVVSQLELVALLVIVALMVWKPGS